MVESPCTIMERWFERVDPASKISNICSAGHEVDNIISTSKWHQKFQQGDPTMNICAIRPTTPNVLCATELPTGICQGCRNRSSTGFIDSMVSYGMVGAIYYGGHHFTVRYVDDNHNMWYNDGIVHGRLNIIESQVETVSFGSLSDRRQCTVYMYARTDS